MNAAELQLESSFYVAGGTLSRDALCYVTRGADRQLYDGLRQGRLSYVLTARQMGKSSLMVRTAARLRDDGIGVVVLDLTAIGQNLSAEQWYGGLLTQMASQLSLEDELEEFWDSHPGLGPLQRWMQAVRMVVLTSHSGHVVIFIDEIDAVRSLPFSTDEFFAALREFYNRRTEDPELHRLGFCLLGVAAPSDLIRDTRMTPFNIGQRIELNDFSEVEAGVLTFGLGDDDEEAKALLGRILYWTGGHPYLTQRLCHAVSEYPQSTISSPQSVDRLCAELFFERRAREQDDNLLFVRERLLRSDVDLARLLSLYERAQRGKKVEDDDRNPFVTTLKLSGIARIENGRLQVRNRIYERVFDHGWVARNMPDAEVRRRRAVNRKVLWWVAAAMILATALLGLKLFNTGSRPLLLNSYRDWDIVRLTRTGGSISPAISRDGEYVACVTTEVGRSSLWVIHLPTSARQQIVPPERFGYFDLAFTPDGSELYFTRREGTMPELALYRIPALGGIAKRLRDDLISRFTISPDGAHVAFARRTAGDKSEFIVANSDGVEERLLAGYRLERPAWSPDGKTIAFTTGTANSGAEEMSIHEIRLSDGATKELSPKRWTHISYLSWLPEASGLVVTARDQKSVGNLLWFVAYPEGEARPISDNSLHFSNTGLTEDARVLVAEQVIAVSDIWRGPLADMADAKKIGVWGRDGLGLVADGRVVYSSIQSGSGEAAKIWMMNGDGMEQKQLTVDRSNDICPVASPDGRYIVYASNRSGNFEIWRMNTDGSNAVQLTDSKGANPPSISPDGRWLIYLSTNDNCLYRIPLEGGEPRRLANNAVGFSAVSPDGKLIAYFATGRKAWNIAVSAFPDGALVRQFEPGSHSLNNTALEWTPDGKGLLYSGSSDGVSNIWMQRLDGSAPQQVTDFKADGIFRFDVSNDGKELICARGGWKHDIVLVKNFR